MFNTGARVQEIVDVQVRDLQLSRPYQVRLSGKGRKVRYCPLWPQTAAVLQALCAERALAPDASAPVFLNRAWAAADPFWSTVYPGQVLCAGYRHPPIPRQEALASAQHAP